MHKLHRTDVRSQGKTHSWFSVSVQEELVESMNKNAYGISQMFVCPYVW
jgi:hypothetical protein